MKDYILYPLCIISIMEQMDVPKEGVDPVRSSCCSGFADRTCYPGGDPCCFSLFLKYCTPLEGLVLKKFMEVLLWEGPYTGAGGGG